MGNYASYADVLDTYEDDLALAHATHDEETGTPNQDLVNRFIVSAEARIDARLVKRYSVPIDLTQNTALGPLLKEMTVSLVRYQLDLNSGVLTDARKADHDQIMADLDRYAEGGLDLPCDEVLDSATHRGVLVRYGTASTEDATKRLFSRESMAGF